VDNSKPGLYEQKLNTILHPQVAASFFGKIPGEQKNPSELLLSFRFPHTPRQSHKPAFEILSQFSRKVIRLQLQIFQKPFASP